MIISIKTLKHWAMECKIPNIGETPVKKIFIFILTSFFIQYVVPYDLQIFLQCINKLQKSETTIKPRI